jgi:hypothetical protein
VVVDVVDVLVLVVVVGQIQVVVVVVGTNVVLVVVVGLTVVVVVVKHAVGVGSKLIKFNISVLRSVRASIP